MKQVYQTGNQSNLTLIDTIFAAYIRRTHTEHCLVNRIPFNSMNLFTLLDEQNVIPNLQARNKKDVINTMVDALSSKFDEDTLEAIRKGVFERENVMSTGVGKGLAIPHCKTKVVVENYAVFAKLSEPLDFNSIDDEPVEIIFLLVGPDSKHSHHIKLLSRISRLMNSASFKEKILSSETEEVILEAFREEEEKYFVH